VRLSECTNSDTPRSTSRLITALMQEKILLYSSRMKHFHNIAYATSLEWTVADEEIETLYQSSS